MSDKCKYRVGQWVRFYRNAELVMAEVRYVREAERWPHPWELLTDRGAVEESHIVEAR